MMVKTREQYDRENGMSLMIQVAGVLKTMAKDFGVAVLVTNHVTRSVSGDVQPGLGASWSHVPRTRVLLERVETPPSASRSGLRSATLIKSSRQNDSSAAQPKCKSRHADSSNYSLCEKPLKHAQPLHVKQEFDLGWWSRARGGPSGKRKLDQTES